MTLPKSLRSVPVIDTLQLCTSDSFQFLRFSFTTATQAGTYTQAAGPEQPRQREHAGVSAGTNLIFALPNLYHSFLGLEGIRRPCHRKVPETNPKLMDTSFVALDCPASVPTSDTSVASCAV